MTLTAEIRRVEAPAWEARIFIAGSLEHCKILLARYAVRGACFSVEPTEFIYTGGRETGCVIRLINYPRFAEDPLAITAQAVALAEVLLVDLHQASCTVQTPERAYWLTRRPE